MKGGTVPEWAKLQVALDERDTARARLVEAVGLLRTLDKGDLPLAQVSTFLASPESAAPAGTAPRMEDARIYPCADCGLMRSKAEGGTTFTVCDACWEKHAAPAQEVAPPVPPSLASVACRGCGKPLAQTSWSNRLADGCECNSPRGVNHGLVPAKTCTCKECDPGESGSSRNVNGDPK